MTLNKKDLMILGGGGGGISFLKLTPDLIKFYTLTND